LPAAREHIATTATAMYREMETLFWVQEAAAAARLIARRSVYQLSAATRFAVRRKTQQLVEIPRPERCERRVPERRRS